MENELSIDPTNSGKNCIEETQNIRGCWTLEDQLRATLEEMKKVKELKREARILME